MIPRAYLAYLKWCDERAAGKEAKAWKKLYEFMQKHPEMYQEFLKRQLQERQEAHPHD